MERHGKKHIFKALKIADDLMRLANNEEVIGRDSNCDVLFGVMRDCAYKIRRQAAHEARRIKRRGETRVLQTVQEQSFGLKKSVTVLAIVLIFAAVAAGPVNANIILSVDNTETLGGLSFSAGDLVEYNPKTNTSPLYFDENLLSSSANIDGAYITPMPEAAAVLLLGLGSLVPIRKGHK